VDDLAEALSGRGRDAAALHGGLAQEQRDRIMGRFRDGALDVLVATDVAARGLDIEHVTHVVNYDVPSSPDTYVHRIGRTGRAGREGVAITLVEPREHRLLRDIERTVGAPLEIAGLPTVADLREKRMDLLRGSLREALVSGGHDRYRAVVEPLADEFDLVDIALAAVAQADEEARGAEDTTELAPASLPTTPSRAFASHGAGRRPPFHGDGPNNRSFRARPAAGPRHGGEWAPAPPRSPAADGEATPPPARPYPPRPPASRPASKPGPRGFRPSGWQTQEGRPVMRQPARNGYGSGVTRLFVGLGRSAGVRPGDLVGAITNEAGLTGRDIGAIQIADGFSLVEVPEGAVDRVIGSLRGKTIRGQSVVIRRERY
jgi:ATP-dependent RNA helicase DeaD